MYTIKILNSEEYDKLPYKHAKDSLGCADAKAGKAFVRATGVKEWDMATLSHEVDELVAKVSPHEEDGIRYKGSKVETKVVEDPYKMAVTNPLSAYLSTQIGRGTPSYASTGKSLYSKLDPQATASYQNFMGINAGDWYKKAVVDPTMEDMKDQFSYLDEGWAGSLRGSGRFADREDFTSDVASELAQGRYQAELEIPQAQFTMGQAYKTMEDKNLALDYADWFQSLAQNNPALNQALSFIANPDGRDVITYEKKSSGIGETVGSIVGMIALGVLTGGLGFAMAPGLGALSGLGVGGSAMLGGMGGGMVGSLFD
jgi:hypothetical protein